VKSENDGLNILDLIDSLETPDTVEPVSIMDLLNNLSSIDFDSLSTSPETVVRKIDSLSAINDAVVITTASQDDSICKGCNPPSVFWPDTSPGYYDERCTCTYCPSCGPLEQDVEYDPLFPFYHDSICKCSDN
jgi:hypothetical protein